MANSTIVAKVKTALRVTTDAFDSEISDLIDACLLDLGIAGVSENDTTDPLIIRAVCTYCKANFGSPDEYDRLKSSYDEQKAQMGMTTGYTEWE
jgi:hypothetical protein